MKGYWENRSYPQLVSLLGPAVALKTSAAISSPVKEALAQGSHKILDLRINSGPNRKYVLQLRYENDFKADPKWLSFTLPVPYGLDTPVRMSIRQLITGIVLSCLDLGPSDSLGYRTFSSSYIWDIDPGDSGHMPAKIGPFVWVEDKGE